jgi:hypothetical protein
MDSNRRSLILAALAAPAIAGVSASVAAADPSNEGKKQKDEHESTPPWDAASVNLSSKGSLLKSMWPRHFMPPKRTRV